MKMIEGPMSGTKISLSTDIPFQCISSYRTSSKRTPKIVGQEGKVQNPKNAMKMYPYCIMFIQACPVP
jgi:hypothetical protein